MRRWVFSNHWFLKVCVFDSIIALYPRLSQGGSAGISIQTPRNNETIWGWHTIRCLCALLAATVVVRSNASPHCTIETNPDSSVYTGKCLILSNVPIWTPRQISEIDVGLRTHKLKLCYPWKVISNSEFRILFNHNALQIATNPIVNYHINNWILFLCILSSMNIDRVKSRSVQCLVWIHSFEGCFVRVVRFDSCHQ